MRVLCIAASAALLSGSQIPDGAEIAAVETTTMTVEAELDAATRIDQKLRSLNRHLQDSQVERIREAILRSSERHGLDPILVASIMTVESTGRPHVRSPKGALGLMQVMPYMIRPLDLAGNPATIEANIEASCIILSSDIRRLGEDDGISTYFWGSNIRGTGYLEKVRAAQESLARDVRS
jgi:hypothetical protein